LLEELQREDFVEIKCRELDETEVKEELQRLGFSNVSDRLILLCKNLLNLEILSTIKIEDPSFNPTDVEEEVALWEKYLDTIQKLESDRAGFDAAEQTINEAMKLAGNVLASDRQSFVLEKPLSTAQRSLVSWGVIVHENGLRYRFKHEKLQDHLFARYCADYEYMPLDVLNAVGPVRSRNALVWLGEIYRHRNSPLHIQFLERMLNG